MTYVTKINKMIAGFSNLTHGDHLNRLYDHKNYHGKGIARSWLEVGKIELEAKNRTSSTNASITAEPFLKNKVTHHIRTKCRT
ncbi:GNAT family N-acetyltransferase [Virgibacillus sp. FSP13]